MAELTKQQKMDMVSKAIDAGFHVEVKVFFVKSFEELDEKLMIFNGLEFKSKPIDEDQTMYVTVNRESGYRDKFEAAVFFE